jgi:hypothetical protein
MGFGKPKVRTTGSFKVPTSQLLMVLADEQCRCFEQ